MATPRARTGIVAGIAVPSRLTPTTSLVVDTAVATATGGAGLAIRTTTRIVVEIVTQHRIDMVMTPRAAAPLSTVDITLLTLTIKTVVEAVDTVFVNVDTLPRRVALFVTITTTTTTTTATTTNSSFVTRAADATAAGSTLSATAARMSARRVTLSRTTVAAGSVAIARATFTRATVAMTLCTTAAALSVAASLASVSAGALRSTATTAVPHGTSCSGLSPVSRRADITAAAALTTRPRPASTRRRGGCRPGSAVRAVACTAAVATVRRVTAVNVSIALAVPCGRAVRTAAAKLTSSCRRDARQRHAI
jgi:hypothetical protein